MRRSAFVRGDGRAIAWVDVGGERRRRPVRRAGELRELAAAATGRGRCRSAELRGVASCCGGVMAAGRVSAWRGATTSAEAGSAGGGAVGGCGAGGWSWRCVAAVRRAAAAGASARPSPRRVGVAVAVVLVAPGRGGALCGLRAARVGGVVAGVDWTAGCRACVRGGCRRSRRASWSAVRVRRAGRRSPSSSSARASSSRRVCGCARCASRATRDDAATRHGDARAARPVRRDAVACRGRTRDARALSLWEPIPVGVDELGEHGRDRAARAQRAARRRAGRGQVAPRCRCWSPPPRSTRPRGCGCWTASSSSWRRGRRARSGSPARTSTRRSSCCASCARRWRRATASCSPRGARKIARDDGLPLHLVACDELAFYLTLPRTASSAREFAELLRDLVARGRAAGVIVVRGDAEARRRRRAVGAARPVRVPAGAALQHAAGVGHDPRPGLGDASGTTRRRSRPAQRGVGLLLAEDGLPVRLRGFYLDDQDVDAARRRAAALLTRGRR